MGRSVLNKGKCDIIKPLYVSMSHGRLFRIASEWQKKRKQFGGFERYEKTWKMRVAALLLTAVCTVGRRLRRMRMMCRPDRHRIWS